jgi:DNA-binding transcriptional LysR family regulator
MYSADLPPLELLTPFEAAARHGSFTRAADELSVTQSAVSQRVRTLEARLGVRLFERGHRRVRLTPEGRELQNGASAALRHLRAATRSLRQPEDLRAAHLVVDSAIAAFWLTPRLDAHLARSDGASIRLTVSDDPAAARDADVAIQHGDGAFPGFAAQPMLPDAVFAVCAPSYLARKPLRRPQDLLDADLIDLDYLHWNWMNWGIWLTEAGLDPAVTRRIARTNDYQSLIALARAGRGVALAWPGLHDADIAAGRLVAPLDITVTTGFGYYLLTRHDADAAARALASDLAADLTKETDR